MAFFHPNIQRFHHHFAIAYCQNMISRVRWESASRYLIVYLEKLFDVCGLFNNFLGMWQLIIYRETNCPVRQGGVWLGVKAKFPSQRLSQDEPPRHALFFPFRLSRGVLFSDQTRPHPSLRHRRCTFILIVRISSQQTAVSLR